jgi:hypothetical protein
MKSNKLQPIIMFGFLALFLFSGIVTTAAQAASTATPTPFPSKTPIPTPTTTATPTPQGSELIFQIMSGRDDVNESGGTLDPSGEALWAGNNGSGSGHYLALRFTNIDIPPGSIINTAHLEVYHTSEQWIYLTYDIAAEAADNSEPFSSDNLPSQRNLTVAVVSHESNVKWLENTWYPLNEMASVIQEVINRPGWQMNNSLSIIVQGIELGGDFGRKFFSSFENEPLSAVRLVIDVSPGTTSVNTLTPSPTAPTQTPTSVPIPTTTGDACAAVTLPARLVVGQEGQIVSGDLTRVNVRQLPSLISAIVGRLEQGMPFKVIDGPVCADRVHWFQVRYGEDNIAGWLAEGQNNAYFVEPLP